MRLICATVKDKVLRASPANRILDVASGQRGQAKSWLLELDPGVREDVLRSHAIPPESFELLRNGEHDEFLRSRMQFLGQLERSFMKEVGVTPPSSDEAALSALDTDDTESESPLDLYAES